MIKLIAVLLVLLTIITSCNNQNHPKENIKETADFPSASEKILRDSIAKFPESLLLKEELIQLYRDSANFDKAITTVDQFLQTDSLNDRLWDIKATLHFENDDTLNAVKSFETALNINPQPRYIILLGSLYAQTKNLKALDMADFLLKAKIAHTDKEAFFIKGLYPDQCNLLSYQC